jgi:hypothetical protein
MNSTVILGIFVPVFLTLLLAVGSVYAFRGSYYKSLPGQVAELQKALQRVGAENVMLKDMVIGKAELKEIIEILKKHDEEAEVRHETSVRMSDRQHGEILGNILDIKAKQTRRERDGI